MTLTMPVREQTRARHPDEEGHVERDGVRVVWERYGDGAPTVFLLPTWSIIHSRFWKAQVPYLARHFQVLTCDGRGNGRSDRPSGAGAYTEREFAADALAVMDATATRQAVLVSLSCGALWATVLAAERPERVAGIVCLHRTGRRPGPAPSRAGRPLLPRAARHRRGLGQVQPALLAARLPRLPRLLLLAVPHRAPLDQAARGLRRLGPGDRPGDPDRHRGGPAAVPAGVLRAAVPPGGRHRL